jgi:hypothetical protein
MTSKNLLQYRIDIINKSVKCCQHLRFWGQNSNKNKSVKSFNTQIALKIKKILNYERLMAKNGSKRSINSFNSIKILNYCGNLWKFVGIYIFIISDDKTNFLVSGILMNPRSTHIEKLIK